MYTDIGSTQRACFFFLCRNRLESNTEHWNALLLSLRELIEWVIRKDTELTGLGPVCGDVAALQKQQASRRMLAVSRIDYPGVPLRRISVNPHKVDRHAFSQRLFVIFGGDGHTPFNILRFAAITSIPNFRIQAKLLGYDLCT